MFISLSRSITGRNRHDGDYISVGLSSIKFLMFPRVCHCPQNLLNFSSDLRPRGGRDRRPHGIKTALSLMYLTGSMLSKAFITQLSQIELKLCHM